MKQAIRYMLLAVMLLGTTMVHAKVDINAVSQAGFNNLPVEEQTKILQQIAAAQPQAQGAVASTAEAVDKWVTVGEHIGKMLGGAAKEVGVAANEFVKTDVGKMTAYMIVWNYMGKDALSILIHVGLGLIILFVGLPWIYIVMRRSQDVRITYDPEKTNIFGNYRKTSVDRSALTGGDQALFLISSAIVAGVAILVIVSF